VPKTRLQPGLSPGPRWGSLQRSSDPLAGFKGPTSKGMDGREGEERRGKGMGRERKGQERKRGSGKRKGRERVIQPIGPIPVLLFPHFKPCASLC